jgi:hypothetical protein
MEANPEPHKRALNNNEVEVIETAAGVFSAPAGNAANYPPSLQPRQQKHFFHNYRDPVSSWPSHSKKG